MQVKMHDQISFRCGGQVKFDLFAACVRNRLCFGMLGASHGRSLECRGVKIAILLM